MLAALDARAALSVHPSKIETLERAPRKRGGRERIGFCAAMAGQVAMGYWPRVMSKNPCCPPSIIFHP